MTVRKEIEYGLFGNESPPRFKLPALVYLRVIRDLGLQPTVAECKKIYQLIAEALTRSKRPTKPAYDATQAGRVAVQAKQRELHAVAADVQKGLVKLRIVVRIALGSSHLDYQRLRIRTARVADAEDESPSETTDSSPESG